MERGTLKLTNSAKRSSLRKINTVTVRRSSVLKAISEELKLGTNKKSDQKLHLKLL